MDQHDIMLAGYEEGLEVGIEQGSSNKQREIAKNLLKFNLTIEQIGQVTGLAKEEIEALKETK